MRPASLRRPVPALPPAPPPPGPSVAPNAFRLALLYTVVFVEIGIAMPFMPVWLNAQHLDAGLIGGLLALPIAIRIVATAPLMGLIDRGFSARTLLLTGSLVLAATYALMPAGAALGWGLLAVLIAINAVAAAPMVASIDYLTLAAVRLSAEEESAAQAGAGRAGTARPKRRLDYPRIRMAGSIGFLGANLAGGALLGVLGEAFAVPLLLTGLALIASAVAYASRDVAGGAGRASPGTERPRLPRKLRLAIGAAALIQASHAAIYAFGSIAWSTAGVPGAWIGALWAIGVAAEILLFAVIGRVPAPWRSPFRLLALGAAAAILRAIGMAWAGDSLPALVGLQMLHAFTFGATHFGAMNAVSAFAPDGARGRAQGTVSSATALCSSLATLGCGVVYRSAGPATTFALMAPVALAGLCLVGFAARAARRGG
ncbi:MFS transporter [Methylobacterium brachythecii]|uniref:MFS transporter n=2 Tax=Methylobacterium brachythecii TaxID=1176177 RepID=UPI00161BDC7C